VKIEKSKKNGVKAQKKEKGLSCGHCSVFGHGKSEMGEV
jgi:hypothetical protein